MTTQVKIDYYPSVTKLELEECKFMVWKTITGIYFINTIGPAKFSGEGWVSFDELKKFPNLGIRFEKKLKTGRSYPLKSYKNTNNAIKHLRSFFESLK